MSLRYFALILIIACPLILEAQIGGYGVYKFVNLPPSSRTSALGGNLISVKDDDVTLAIQNPSLLNASMNKHLALSYIDYMADVSFGSAVYAHMLDSQRTLMGGIQYLNYGTFSGADETGYYTGIFKAADYNIFMGYGRNYGKFSYGGSLKIIYSSYERYKSFGLATDISGTYVSENQNLSAAVVFKNIGLQLKPYYNTREPLPFEIQMGVALKPEHMPLRVSIIAHDLQRWDLTYTNPNIPKEIDLSTGEEIEQKVPFSENLFRHFIFGGELLISKNFNIRVGYNHQLRKEMTIPNARGLVGYSFGFGFRINKFHISYGRTAYHIAGGSNTFTLSTDLGKLIKKGKAVETEPAEN